MAAGGHPDGHAGGHQGRIQGAIQQAIHHAPPAGFPHQVHLIEAVLGEEALGFSDGQGRAGRQGHKPQIQIHLLKAVTGEHLVGLGLPLLHPLLPIEEIDHFRAQAVVARVMHHR
jgi:hypothetical protein